MRVSPVTCMFIGGLGMFAAALTKQPSEHVDLVLQNDGTLQAIQESKFVSDFEILDDVTDDESESDEESYDSDSEEDSESEDEDEDEVMQSPSPAKKSQKLLHLPKDILTCGASPFGPEAVSAAISAGLEIIQKQTHWKNKPRQQPHWYNNREGFDFPDCTEGRMFEFPILIGGKVHRGGRTGSRAPPGAHRVIFKADQEGGTFCGLITHEDAESRGSFVACT